MKKVVLISALVAIAATTVASATLVVSKDRTARLEQVARLQNLSIIALENKDLMLACKAEIVAANALGKSKHRSDVAGSIKKSRDTICNQAVVADLKKNKSKKA